MRVVVTGAAGLTGGAIVRVLIARGNDVLAVVRRPEQRAWIPDGVDVAVADCAEPASIGPVLARADALVHVAGIHLGPSLAATGQLDRLERAVAISSSGILSRHRKSVNVYRAGEDELRSARPSIVVVRPTMIYGSPHDRNAHHVIAFARRSHFLPIVGTGDALLQPIHYEDLAAAAVALLDAAGQTVAAGGERAITLREAAVAIFEAVGLPPRFVRVPRGPALALATAADRIRGSRIRERIERMTEDRSVDNAALVSLTGVRPRAFRDGVRDEVRAMRSEAR